MNVQACLAATYNSGKEIPKSKSLGPLAIDRVARSPENLRSDEVVHHLYELTSNKLHQPTIGNVSDELGVLIDVRV